MSRLCTSSPDPPGLTTWVTPPSRVKNGEPTMRSRSARNGLVARSPRARALPPNSRRARGSTGGSMIATVARQNAPRNPHQKAERRRDPHCSSAHRRGTRRRRAPGTRGRGAARRRCHRAVHRALPQGGHRAARRHPAAHPGGAPALPARAGRAPGGGAGVDPRPGQAGRGPGSADHGGRLEVPPGGHLPAVQAEAADPGADRPRGRAGAPGRRAARRPDAGPARRPLPATSTPTRGWPTPPPRWTGRGPS